MFYTSNPRWTRLLLGVLFLVATLTASAAFAGNTHSEGGAVVEAPGVPETDGTATVQIYWSGDSAARTSVTTGATLAGYWLQDVGFALARPWLVGDEHLALLESETGAGTAAHAGYYGVSTQTITSMDPDEFPAMTVRPIPVPVAAAGGGFVDVAWNRAASAGSPDGIAGYNIYRATDGINFAKLNATVLADTTYRDNTVVFGTTYQYALALAYRGTPALEGSAFSANSEPVTPLDATPPDVPVIAAESAFTPGAANSISWSSEAASGAAAYYAECALDPAFSSLMGNSGWIADSSATFSDLADGRTYYFRVRARDAAQNASDYSEARHSRQDASAPASHLLALAAYKASSTVSLEWTASDSLSGVASVQLYYGKDGGPFALHPGGPFTSSPIAFDASTAGGDGQYAFYTRATDAVANAEDAPEAPDATTIVDTQPPAIPAIAALPDFTPGTSRILSWSSRAASGATSYRAQASVSEDFAVVAHASDWIADSTFTFTDLADGARHWFRVQSRDQAGNDSDFGALAASTQDASGPATAAEELPALSNHPAFEIAWSGTDATSGLAGTQLLWSKDGGAFATLDGGPFTTSPIAFDAAAHGGDGTYAFYTLGTDAAGNAEAAPASADANITIDTMAPTAPAIAALPAFTAGAARAISWTGGDATAFLAQAATDSGFASIAFETGWIATPAHEFGGLAHAQQYFYRVRGRDAAGNESAFSEALASTQDASAPATAVAALPATANSSTVAIAWTGSDSLSGLAGVQLYWSKDAGPSQLYPGGPWTASPIAFDATQANGDGEYGFYTRGTDAVGNAEEAPASSDAHILIDTAAPGAPSIAGLQTFAPGSTLALAWSDESAGGALEYQAEAASDPTFAVVETSTGWIAGLAHEFAGLGNGQRYYFRVRARDAALNETGWSGLQSTTMDATAPTSGLESLPASGNDPHLSLAWSANDATSGVEGVDLYISKDGGPYQLAAGSPFASSPIAFDASALGDGDYGFYTRAHDHVGNIENAPASPDASTHLDTTAPQAPAIAALPAYTPGTSRNLSWTDQSASGAAAYLAQASADAGFAAIAFETGWIPATAHEFSGLADGQIYYYRVKSRDALGNESAFAATLHSTQDASAPTSQIAALPALSASLQLALAWSGSDAASGLESAELYWSKDGAPFALYPGGPFTSSPIAFDAATTGGDGEYAFYAITRDAVGNVEAAPADADAQTSIDTAAPGAPVLASLPSYAAGSALTIQWENLGAGTTAYRAQMSSSPSFASLDQDSGWITGTQHTFASLQDAHAYWFRVQARDAAQNASGFSAPGTTTMDAVAPTSQLAALPALANTAALPLEWSGSDMTSGIAAVDLYTSRNGGPFALHPGSPFASSPIAFDATAVGGDGQYAFYIRARDAVGNLEAAPTAPDAQIRIDTTPPNVPAIAALPQFAPGASIVLAWSNQSATGAVEYLAEMSTDASFGSIAAQSSWIPATSYSFNSLDDGQTCWFRVKTRDAAQNESNHAAAQSTTLDDTAPASSVNPLASVTTTLGFPIAWTGSDATSGVASVDLYYARDAGAYTLYPGGPWTSSPIGFDAATTGGQGTYAFYTRARDRVSNREPAPAGPDAQTIVNTAAVGSPILAALPAFTPGTSRSLSWTPGGNSATALAQAATDPAFASIAAQSSWTSGTSHTFDALIDGQTYWYRVKARSSLGIEGSWSGLQSSTQDATAPQSQVLALPALQTSSTFAIAWSASDATSGITGVRLYVSRDGGAYSEYAGGPFASSPIAFDAAALGGDGTYAFYTRATDIAGNAESAPANPDAGTIVTTAAVGAPVLAALPGFTAGTSRTLSWTPGVNNNIYLAQAATDPAFASIAAQSSWTSGTSHIFDALIDGQTYWYRVKARSSLGIEGSWSALRSSTQDATPPQSQVAALPALQTTLSFAIAWSASDATSGIAAVRLYASRDGGAYAEYAGGPFTSSPIAFDAAALGGDGAYTFYTRATDVAGNDESAPAVPDAETQVTTSVVGMPTLAALPQYTPGTSLVLDWAPGAYNTNFLAQAASDAAFTAIVAQSSWTSATSYTFDGLTDGQPYWYRVKARSSLGIEGHWSGLRTSTQDATPPQSQVAALPALQTTLSLAVDWSASDATSGIAAVRLYVSRDGGAYLEYAGGPFTSSPIAFDAAALGGDGTYAFYTRATDHAGNAEAAPPAPDATTLLDTTAPIAPAMIDEPASTPGASNTVAWNATADASAYFAQCAIDAAFLSPVASTGWIAATSYTFTDLMPGTTYYYRVRARDAALNASPYSAAVTSTQSAGYILPAGWNLISFNVDPTDRRIDRVLASIAGSYNIVRTYASSEFRTYLPSLPVGMNDLQEMDGLHGYWIYMTKADTLLIGGTPISTATPIDLRSGWNLASYLPSSPMNPGLALASIQGSYALARGYETGRGYRTYYPSMPGLSDLTEMHLGQGYWMYMTAADQLVYGGFPKPQAGPASGSLPVAVLSDATSVPTVMDVWSTEFTLDGEPAPAGTVLEAHDAAGHLVGSATVKTAGMLPILHLHGDVSITDADEGAIAGETLTLVVRDRDLTWVGKEPLVWQADAAREMKLEFVATESLLPKAFALAANAPNPFNPSTTIAYAIPARVDGEPLATTHVDLRIFDIRGREVRTLVSAPQGPGRYSVVWDGRDQQGRPAGSGVYFYRLRTDAFTQARKMMLVK